MKCKECGKDINPKAEICPNCGCRVKSNTLKIIIICIVVMLSFLGVFYAYNKINSVIKQNQKDIIENQKKEDISKLYGNWKLVSDQSDEIKLDDVLVIRDKNVIFRGLNGIYCFNNQDNHSRIDDCEYVQIGSYEDEKEIRISFYKDGNSKYLCFNRDNDYLNEVNCSHTINGEYDGNLNVKYQKIN